MKSVVCVAFAFVFSVSGLFAAAIHDAVDKGELDTVANLVAKDAGVLKAIDDSTDLNYMSYQPLHLAVKKENKEMVALLLDKGADPKGESADSKRTPLHVCTETWNKEITDLLIAKGADVNGVDANGYTPLHLLVGWSAGCEEYLQYLLDKGADPKKLTTGYNPSTPFHDACLKPFNLPALKIFVEKCKLDVNLKTGNGATPLVLAAQGGSLEMMQYLADKGGDLKAEDEEKNTLLALASVRGELELVDWLLGKGLDPKAVNKASEGPLHRAAWGSDEEKQVVIMKKLIEKGADPALKDKDGKTAKDIAEKNGKTIITEFLAKPAK